MDGSRVAPAGWYPDPGGSGWWRWWDGRMWTTTVHPPAGPVPVHPVTGQPCAEFLPRAAAVLLDSVILAVPTYLLMGLLFVSFILSLDPETGAPSAGFLGMMLVLLPLVFLVIWALQAAYFVWFESRRGATPGKAALGLRVVDVQTGGPISTGQAVGRFLGRFVSGAALYIGYFVALSHPLRQTWHDEWSRSVVIRTR